jgi:hypothetical protein
MFSHVSHIDANQSQFSNVGRDKYTVAHQTNLILASNRSQAALQHVLRSFCPSGQEVPPSPSTMIITRYTPHDNRRACEAACNLIVEITRLLVDLTKFSDDYQYSQKLSLNPLHDTLFLTGLAIQAYENTPLAQNVNLVISPDIQKCHLILQGMLDTVDSYRQSLYRMPIYKLWPEVLWSGSEVQKLAWKLSIPKSSLGQFLVALNS